MIMTTLNRVRWLSIPLAFLLGATVAFGQQVQALKPADRSSPRAAMQTFLDSGDALREFIAHDYLPSPSRSKYEHVIALANKSIESLDLSEVPPAARPKTGYSAASALYEVLSRIPLPPADHIPDADQIKTPAGAGADTQRWIIPDTEIALVRLQSGAHSGQYVFSADTVARAEEFYERVRDLPYVRPAPLKDLHGLISSAGGWMIPYAWIQALPAWLRAPVAGQSLWKWIGLTLIVAAFALWLRIAYRVTQLGKDRHPLLHALARLATPVAVLLAMPVVEELALVQLILSESVGSAVELATSATTYLALAWLAWRFTGVVAEAILSSPRFGPQSLDAHIIRAGISLFGIGATAALLVMGADRVGMPVYGIVAGLGVGGLAVALAAQPTIENLIGGLSLFADKPVRVGDFCQYGDQSGTVEAIGIRSARIRGMDRTLTTIPNAVLAKMPIVNVSQRDRMLIQTVIGLRYETNEQQLRNILGSLRDLLLTHPRILSDTARARFVGLGACSLDIEVFAYVMTPDWPEFLGIREEILLRVMQIVEAAGTSFAFPSQTLYLGRDRIVDPVAATAVAPAGGR